MRELGGLQVPVAVYGDFCHSITMIWLLSTVNVQDSHTRTTYIVLGKMADLQHRCTRGTRGPRPVQRTNTSGKYLPKCSPGHVPLQGNHDTAVVTCHQACCSQPLSVMRPISYESPSRCERGLPSPPRCSSTKCEIKTHQGLRMRNLRCTFYYDDVHFRCGPNQGELQS